MYPRDFTSRVLGTSTIMTLVECAKRRKVNCSVFNKGDLKITLSGILRLSYLNTLNGSLSVPIPTLLSYRKVWHTYMLASNVQKRGTQYTS